jgi:TolB-like protein/predicted Zn-dependent protease
VIFIAGLITLLLQDKDRPTPLAALGEPPVIAVLPFANMSGDPDQLYFSDGLTEDLTTDLSQVSGLRMISSASSFTYRDSDLTPEAIARDLGASHLVTGSVRRDGRRLRINATLTETVTGANVWASRFDRDIGGVFDLQDEVARAITSALAITLTSSEEQQFQRNQAIDPDAYDMLLRGLAPLRRFTAEGIDEARRYFRRAIEIDPDYARAHANLALSYGQAVVFRLGEDMSSLDIALREAHQAVELDPALPQAQFALAVVQLSARNHDAATAAARQSVKLDPNYADGYAVLAQTLAYDGDLDDALVAIRTAKTLSPRYTFAYLWVEAHILFQQRQYEDSRAILEDVVDRNPAFLVGYLILAAIYGKIDQTEEAEWLVSEILTLSPEISALKEGNLAPYRRESDREHYIEGLLRAGLPE